MTDRGIGRRQVLGFVGAASAFGLVHGSAGGAVHEESPPGDGPSGPPQDATTDPHTLATYRALVAASVPETPVLADELDDPAQESGGRAIELSRFVVWGLNNFVGREVLPGTGGEGRLAEPIAAALDAAATELLARDRNESEPDPTRFRGGGPFAALAPRDRFRSMRLLEDQDLPTSRIPESLRAETSAVSVNYLVAGLHAVVFDGYYSEWAGYGDTGLEEPPAWEFTGDVPSWEQTDYPGPSDGYAGYRYVLDDGFREGDYGGDGQ